MLEAYTFLGSCLTLAAMFTYISKSFPPPCLVSLFRSSQARFTLNINLWTTRLVTAGNVTVICTLHLTFLSTLCLPPLFQGSVSHPSYHGHQMKGLIRGGQTQRDHIKNKAVGFRSSNASNTCFKNNHFQLTNAA